MLICAWIHWPTEKADDVPWQFNFFESQNDLNVFKWKLIKEGEIPSEILRQLLRLSYPQRLSQLVQNRYEYWAALFMNLFNWGAVIWQWKLEAIITRLEEIVLLSHQNSSGILLEVARPRHFCLQRDVGKCQFIWFLLWNFDYISSV